MLSGKGHEVTVLAPFPNRPQGSIYPSYARRPWSMERSPGGVKIIRCFATLSKRSSILSRFAENVSFGITSGLAILFSRARILSTRIPGRYLPRGFLSWSPGCGVSRS